MVSIIVFIVAFIAAVVWFTMNVRTISANIKLGKDVALGGSFGERFAVMARVALGQSKMVRRPIAGVLHIMVYAGFVIINIEVLEIILDGLTGSHRMFSALGGFYTLLIAAFEWLALGVLVACVIFLIRRNILRIKRFFSPEMTTWPKTDANLILITEILLMGAFLTMNGADMLLMNMDPAVLAAHELGKYGAAGVSASAFPVSSMIAGLLPDSPETLHHIERFCWWFHIIGILAFLNYLPYSKHFHIILAFPNTFWSKLKPKGTLNSLESVKKEVELMMVPNADPFATPAALEGEAPAEPERFGAKDVEDLTWKQLMDAYSCTECGRCTSVCPANITGKKLSPRKIMMATRDRIEETGPAKRKDKSFDDGKSLLRDYISEEEVLACTTCNACTEACPVNIDPVSIIIDLRRFLIMEESKAPNEWTMALTNIENNGAPWQFAATDRLNWKDEQ